MYSMVDLVAAEAPQWYSRSLILSARVGRPMSNEPPKATSNFLRAIIDRDLAQGTHDGRVATRFPPEPNGYLHIGHAKSICLNFGLARDTGGVCHLRFDDTNPGKEDVEFVHSIQEDVTWLGFDWGENLFHASDYFGRMHALALGLIEKGLAYVCSLRDEDARAHRGTVSEAGTLSPYASRSVEENLDLFERMRGGEFPDGAHVLRARIDMAASNMKMRDPMLYRIRHTTHDRTGDAWCIYPLYDFAHCLSDAFERVTHSICTLEFENNRELYDWLIAATEVDWTPRQYEFARLNLGYTVMSKRKLLMLVQDGLVSGWDDPRMPTIAGMRRRGYTPEAIRKFCDMIGVAKANSLVDFAKLEFAIRDDLNHRAPRVMCVLDPIKVVITNYEGAGERLDASHWPHDVPKEGSRPLHFGAEIYIDRSDFMEDPPPKYHRLAPGREVRLRYGYVIRCDEVIKGASGDIVELRCSYFPETQSGQATVARKVKGTIHWVSAAESLPAEVRLFDRLFSVEQPDRSEEDFRDFLNPDSCVRVTQARVEACLALASRGDLFQFERHGYFVVDGVDSRPDALVFNRVVTLRDSWRKQAPSPAAKLESPKKSSGKPKKASSGSKGPKVDYRQEARSRNPALEARYRYYQAPLGLSESLADALSGDPAVTGFFDGACETNENPGAVARWIVNELFREIKDRPISELSFTPADFSQLVAFVEAGEVAARSAKAVLAEMVQEGGGPEAIITRDNLRQMTDPEEVERLVRTVLDRNADALARFRAGQASLRGFFVGQVIKESGGRADPKLVHAALAKNL